jgi:hypothetical protein
MPKSFIELVVDCTFEANSNKVKQKNIRKKYNQGKQIDNKEGKKCAQVNVCANICVCNHGNLYV